MKDSLVNKEQWDKKGYIKVESFFSTLLIEKLHQYCDEIANWKPSSTKWMVWYEDTGTLKPLVSRIENFLDYHKDIKSLLFHDNKINSYLRQILREDVELLKERIIFKAPNTAGYLPHQDTYNIHYNLPSRLAYASVVITLDKSTKDNGCLNFCCDPKHREGIIPTDAKGVILQDIYKEFEWEAVECNPGDIIIFDSYTPHFSRPNNSNNSRRVIYLVYMKKSEIGLTREEYYKKKREIMPPEEKEFNKNNLREQSTILYREDQIT